MSARLRQVTIVLCLIGLLTAFTQLVPPSILAGEPLPPGLWKIWSALINMGETRIAQRLQDDYAAGRVTIGPTPGGAAAVTGMGTLGLLRPSPKHNRMTISESQVFEISNERAVVHGTYSSDHPNVVGLALTVVHEYVHMDQVAPGILGQIPRHEDPAWQRTIAAGVSWYDKVKLDFDLEWIKKPPDVEHLKELKTRLQSVAKALLDLYNEISPTNSEGEVSMGHVSPMIVWKGILGDSNDVALLQKQTNEQLAKDLAWFQTEIDKLAQRSTKPPSPTSTSTPPKGKTAPTAPPTVQAGGADAVIEQSKLPGNPGVLWQGNGDFKAPKEGEPEPQWKSFGPFELAAGGKLRAEIEGNPPVPHQWALGDWNSSMVVTYEMRLGPNQVHFAVQKVPQECERPCSAG